MKFTNLKKLTGIIAAAALVGVSVLGCSKDNTGTASQETTAAAATTDKATVIKIGTSGNPNPYVYTDDNNKLTGYEIEIVERLQELLPQYDFQFEITEFQSIFTGIDSGIYQMGVNNISWKQERADKYLFGDEYVTFHDSALLVRKDYDEITSLADLAGRKTFSTTSGLYSQIFMEDYNENHKDNPIQIVYTEADTIKQYQDLSAGVVDFLFSGSVGLKKSIRI
jgi:polar amino acid transport system substrate-binding protein